MATAANLASRVAIVRRVPQASVAGIAAVRVEVLAARGVRIADPAAVKVDPVMKDVMKAVPAAVAGPLMASRPISNWRS
jgi:hypothetical protein